MKSREEAEVLLKEYTKSESLINHARGVEACMVWYAKFFEARGEQINHNLWAITGLLHDFDYEMYPDPVSPNGHPFKGSSILAELGYPEELRVAIMGHAEYTNVHRETLLAKALFAVDELSGLITACVYVRPDRSIQNLEVKSVVKKFKDKAFARGCSRDDIRRGAEEIGIPLDQHIANCIDGMKPISTELFS